MSAGHTFKSTFCVTLHSSRQVELHWMLGRHLPPLFYQFFLVDVTRNYHLQPLELGGSYTQFILPYDLEPGHRYRLSVNAYFDEGTATATKVFRSGGSNVYLLPVYIVHCNVVDKE